MAKFGSIFEVVNRERDMKSTVGLVAVFAVLLGGCSAFPSQVELPDTTRVKDGTTAYDLSDVGPYTGVFPREFERLRLLDQAGLYAGTWRKAARERRLERDIGANAQFGMAVAGAYNVARSRVAPGKWWLAGAGGLGLVQDKYKVEAQALHYSQAADAMECVRASIADVPPALWLAYDKGELLAAVSDLPADVDPDLERAHSTLSTLFLTINERMSEILHRLEAHLESDKLSVPKADEIKKAATDQVANEAPAERGGVKIASAIVDAQNLLLQARQGKVKALDERPIGVRNWIGRVASLDASTADARRAQYAKLALVSSVAYKKGILLPTKLDECVAKAGS